MANSNTEHSRALRQKHATAANKKAREEGCIVYVALLDAAAEKFKKLAEQKGSKKAALQWLLSLV